MSESEDTADGLRRNGNGKLDPTLNVIAAVEAAVQRQDDLRNQESKHMREVMALRSGFDKEIRLAETSRIDAIRAVDVGNVSRAAEVQAAQATALATQVSASAEAMRVQVAAAAAAAQTALGTALEPIQKDVADLRRVQYEAAGKSAQIVDTRETEHWSSSTLVAVLALAAPILTVILLMAGNHLK